MFICDVGSPDRTGDWLCCCMAKVSPLEARPCDHFVCSAWNKNTKFGFGTDFKLKSACQINPFELVIGLREQTNGGVDFSCPGCATGKTFPSIHAAPPPPHLFLLRQVRLQTKQNQKSHAECLLPECLGADVFFF